jgi:hypothetical protein
MKNPLCNLTGEDGPAARRWEKQSPTDLDGLPGKTEPPARFEPDANQVGRGIAQTQLKNCERATSEDIHTQYDAKKQPDNCAKTSQKSLPQRVILACRPSALSYVVCRNCWHYHDKRFDDEGEKASC